MQIYRHIYIYNDSMYYLVVNRLIYDGVWWLVVTIPCIYVAHLKAV